MAKSRFTEEDKLRIRMLHEERGLSYAAIAGLYHVAPITINRVCNPKIAEKQAAETKLNRPKYYERALAESKIIYRAYSLKFHHENDEQLIKHLSKQDNVSEYIRKLILQDMERQKKTEE